MPALDYVSIIRSVYGDRKAMLAAACGTALAAGLSAYKSQSLPLFVIAFAFILIGLLRYADARAFSRAAIENDDAKGAEYWEHRAVITGAMAGSVYGAWCFISMVVVQDPFAELASATLTTAAMVGLVARNFGLERLLTIQMVVVMVPLAVGYALHGDIYHVVLASLLGVMLASFRKLAADIRSILLSAVHGRVEASRLAAELDMAVATLEHGLCLLDEEGAISVVNEPATRLLGRFGVTDLVGKPLDSVLGALGEGGRLPRTTVDRLLDLVNRRESGKALLSLSEGLYFEVSVSSRHKRCVLLFEDISERVAAEERISFMARYDMLTGLPNRAYFGELITEDLGLRRTEVRQPARIVSLMIIDIDDFKHVNDTHGHLVGDRLLIQVAKRLRDALPEQTILARQGGDEFIAYCSDTRDPKQVDRDIAAIQRAFEAPFVLEGLNLAIKVSIGLVTSTSAEDKPDELMTKADLALYTAKAAGKARSEAFHEQMDIDYHYRQRLKADLRAAIDSNGLTLAFQPLLDISTRKVMTCEALARWHHPELGAIAPSVFIPLAEETGLISDITAWVVEEAARQCQSWPGEVRVAVNISARDFRGTDVAELVSQALNVTGLSPDRLEIEVTETAVIEEHAIAKTALSQLAAQGVSIALDDFGTGYSSLSYLSALPLNKLKIDRSFVVDIENSERSLRLLANVARLGRDLDMTVVAEGVETEAQLKLLLERTQIQQVQGYVFSRPLPARDIAELIGRLNSAVAGTPKKRSMVNRH
jgi:diguanylate cyclase (GGDEF)-like protein